MRLSCVLLCLGIFASSGSLVDQTWNRHTIDSSNRVAGKRGADGVRLLDVNHDGRLDITTGWEEGGAVAIYLNPGPEKAREA